MNKSRIFVAGLAAVSLLGVTACVTDPNTGERHISRTAIGGVAGGVVGYQLDQQIRELDEATAGSGVDVTQTPDGTGILVNLPDVTFAFDSTTISPSFRAALDEVAASLQKYPNSLVDVMGHTDSTGSDSYNLDLSRRRAEAVAAHLMSRNVSRARIATIGYGEQYPRADTSTEQGRALNRRVEIRITPVTQEEVNAAR